MKKIFLILIITISIMLTACGSGKYTEEEVNRQEFNNKLFIKISDEGHGQIIVDKETRVMYWVSCGTYNYGTLTLLVEKNGNPRIWNGQ